MRRKNKSRIIITIFCSIACLFIGVFATYFALKKVSFGGETVINKLQKEVTVNENGIADAVEKLYDAVVVVENYQGKSLVSSGTGFVYQVKDKLAYILTNNHVVSSGSAVKVKFTNNKSYDVNIVGKDEYSDIAVLSIDKDKIISVAEIGTTENSRLGDTLFTIGAPLDSEYSWTVTRGILSGKDRLVDISASNSNSNVASWVMKVIQTDAAINSGNSGGPIANSNGEVIGITNMKLISSGVEGIGFAIPIEDAIVTAEELINNGKISRAFMGVGTLDVSNTDTLIKQYGISIDPSITEGAVVAYVQKGSPADDAGLEKGDVITKFGDYDIKSSSMLKYYVYKYKIGEKVKITYISGKNTKTANIKLEPAAD